MRAWLTRGWRVAARSRGRLAMLGLFCAAMALGPPGGQSQDPVRKSVLIINELGLSHPAITTVNQQILSVLGTDTHYQIEFYTESLDARSFPDEASRQEIRAWIAHKYRNHPPDVILAMGPEPIKFLSGSYSVFPETPIVFCGSTERQAGNPQLDSRFTGTWLRLEPTRTIDAIAELLPRTRQIFVVGGTSDYDKVAEGITRDALQPYESGFAFTYWTELRMDDLLFRLRHLPKHSAVLFTSFWQDGAGQPFVNATAALPMIVQAANVPVFGMSDAYLGRGIVGGFVLDWEEQGKVAARDILELLGGKKPRDVPIVTGPNSYKFDWKQLQRWGLSQRNLPAGSIVLFREPSLWERSKWLVLTSALVILVLGSLTAYLLYKQRQLAQARMEQTRLSGMLINAQEDERRRLASELHDDFSQRLALLSMGLENAAEMVPQSPKEANQQLHELLNSAGELGADLHTLSHRLHSSTLERLGLVPGVGAYCKEFTAQKGVEVVFSHKNVARNVPADTALCLFRVVQEGLRNVKKHSGASQAKVSLAQRNGHLHLSISDDGAGFNVKDAAGREGIGMLTMEERARLIGARFLIRSEPHRGTQIDVWAPLPKKAPAKPVEDAAAETPEAKAALRAGRATLVGAVYEIVTGRVRYLPENPPSSGHES